MTVRFYRWWGSFAASLKEPILEMGNAAQAPLVGDVVTIQGHHWKVVLRRWDYGGGGALIAVAVYLDKV